MFRTLVVSGLLSLTLAVPAMAQNWADAMFKTKTYEFGTVARNAKAEFLFEIENKYAVDVHISGVRASCGCTTPKILKDTLTTYEKGGILAIYNTGTFLGKRGATLTVTFDKPQFAEVQLRVDGYIRSDIVAEPAGVEFGELDMGAGAERSIEIRYLGGRSDWKLTEVKTNHPNLKCELQETQRQGGRTTYKLTTKLDPKAPVGTLNEVLTLVTNDGTTQALPVLVSGRVVAPLRVSPSTILMGVMAPGQKVTRKLVVIGKEPFKITRIDGGEGFDFSVTDTAKKVHVIPFTYTAGGTMGKIERTITVCTEEEGVQASCIASAAVIEGVVKQ